MAQVVGINPVYSVTGAISTEDVASRLIHIRVTDCKEFTNSRFEIQLDNRAPFIEFPAIDSEIQINIGYNDNVRNIGTYKVSECVIYGTPHTITIVGHGVSTGSDIKATKQRSWHNQTLQDVVSAIAGESGLVPNIGGDIGSKKIDHVDQTQSNMGFLTDLARTYNATFKVMNGTLYFGSSNQEQGDALAIDITEETHFEYQYQTRGYFPGGVKARYVDKKEGKEKVATSGGDGSDSYRALNEVFPDKDTAQGAADSMNASMAGSADHFRTTLPGDPLIMSGMSLTFTGLPPNVPSSGWIADQVQHEIRGNGAYTTAVECTSSATDASSTGTPGAGNSAGGNSGGGDGGGGSETEPEKNKEGGDDGHTVTEEVDGNGTIST